MSSFIVVQFFFWEGMFGNQEFGFYYVEFEMFFRRLGGNVKYECGVGGNVQVEDRDVRVIIV